MFCESLCSTALSPLILTSCSTFVTTDKPIKIRYYELKFTVFTLCVVDLSSDKCETSYTHHYNIKQNGFTTIKIPYVSPFISTSFILLTSGRPWSFYWLCTVLSLPECHAVGIIVCSLSHWLLSLTNMHLSFLYVFLGLENSFFKTTE